MGKLPASVGLDSLIYSILMPYLNPGGLFLHNVIWSQLYVLVRNREVEYLKRHCNATNGTVLNTCPSPADK